MKQLVGPVLLATVAAYLWGFLFWGATSLPYGVWERAQDDQAAGLALRDHFPERGTYFVPSRREDAAAEEALYVAGPVAVVHMTAPDGRPMFDASIMVRGVLLTFVVAVLLALLLRSVGSAVPTYADRVAFLTFVAGVAVVLIHGGDAVWWATPLDWKLVQAFYDLTVVLVYALVLARFVPGKPAAA